ncbi:MAG TPA: hypothetical protein VM582_05165 [Candidatus Thermoplasmatota archaeon]|nr:hypothetical protein [Candidatus Thermoplasmatota archaeon]
MLELHVVSASWWFYVLAALACVFVSTKAVRRTPGVIGLALVLTQQALATVAALLAFTARPPELASFGFHAGLVVWLLWSPTVALAGALLLHGTRHAKLARVAAVATGGPNVLLLAASAFRPSLLVAPDGSAATLYQAFGVSLVFVTFAWVVALLAHEALTTRLPHQRLQLALLAMAFAAEGGFHAFQNAAKVLFALDVHGLASAGPVLTLVLALPAALLIPLLGWVVARAAQTRSRQTRRAAWGIAAVLGVAGATGALTAPLAAGDEFRTPIGMFHAFWDLAALLLLTYAAHRFQLVSLETRAKQSIAISFVVMCGFVLFGVVQALAERVIQDRYLAGLPANDILAALAVAAASLPLARGGAAIARRVFPSAVTSAQARRRHEEIYEAAVEGALMDGLQDAKEAHSLASLRAALGISWTDHQRIEARVRQELTAKTPSVSPA